MRYAEAELTIARAALEISELEKLVNDFEESVNAEKVLVDGWNRYRKALNIIASDPGYCGEIARDAIDPEGKFTDVMFRDR